MAFEAAKQSGFLIDPTFMEGYPYPNKYQNVGQLMTPYEGKPMGVGGDYGPPQSTTYYSLENPVYPYPLDEFMSSPMCLPKMCYPDYPPKYPWKYIPGNYFYPQDDYPNMEKVKTAQGFNTYPLGTQPDFHMDGGDYFPGRVWTGKKEKYGSRRRDDRTYGGYPGYRYRRLPTASGPDVPNSNYYPPFNNFY